MQTSRHFGGSILRGGRRNIRNERRRGDITIVLFTQTRGRGDRGEHNSTPGRNSFKGDIMPGKYDKLYRHTDCYACHRHEHFFEAISR